MFVSPKWFKNRRVGTLLSIYYPNFAFYRGKSAKKAEKMGKNEKKLL